ncbi:MAG: glutamine--fructose-6-phosphate transaminase (isomerizing) [Nanoarchaeota archaeon]|nr:glutamine--fructose-6-phosphate transaminase (isomerizing) [Nanoarchaeota archaeon]
MCGIIGYVGKRNAQPILIQGLKRLEYRGYDSAGVALFNQGSSNAITIVKTAKDNLPNGVSPLISLAGKLKPDSAQIGIAHTRWATHGEPNETNAHPHVCNKHGIAVVHNGIIENYRALRKYLESKGHTMSTGTDSEVLAHLIGENFDAKEKDPLISAVQKTLAEIEGTYGMAVMMKGYDGIVAARNGSPLIIGLGDEELFISSDPGPINDHTKNIIRLDDFQVARIGPDGYHITNLDNDVFESKVEKITWDIKQIELSGYDHFMQKEIFQQPQTVQDAFRGRLGEKGVRLDGLDELGKVMPKISRIKLVACGTSWHASKIGKYLFENLAGIPAEVDYASEFRYAHPILDPAELVIVLSQSGETADTLEALRQAKKTNHTFGIVNAVGSLITRENDAGIYIHAGPEIGVASTKAFTGQVTCLYLMALQMGIERGVIDNYSVHKAELESLPGKIKEILDMDSNIKTIAENYAKNKNYLFLGRGINFPVALEGALKLKEISKIHAEGYPAAEMKHGPIALIDKNMPVVFVATGRDTLYEKVLSNMEEVKARKGKIIAVVNQGDERVRDLADHIIPVPTTSKWLAPLLNVIPLQLLAYHTAVIRGKNPDKPENLAKAVTVE